MIIRISLYKFPVRSNEYKPWHVFETAQYDIQMWDQAIKVNDSSCLGWIRRVYPNMYTNTNKLDHMVVHVYDFEQDLNKI